MTHKFIKAAGCKSEQDFYQKYPTEAHFFQAYPEQMPPMSQGHMQTGGFIMPPLDPISLPTVYSEQPQYATGGFYEKPGYHFNGTEMVKSKGSGTYANGVYFKNGGSNYSKHGGGHKQGHKPSPAQLQQMMAMMQQQGQQQPPMPPGAPQMGQPMPMQGQPGMPPQGPPMMQQGPPQQQMGGSPDFDGDIDMLKRGGIYIDPANKGKFTAYKERTGKTTEEALHSPDPHVRKMANFAKNAAGWKHEYGGNIYKNGGGFINELSNPYHPLRQYMLTGGQMDDDLNNDPITGKPLDPNQPQAQMPATGVVADQQSPQSPQWRQGMSDTQANQNINYGAGSVNAYDPTTGNTDNGMGSVNGKQQIADMNNRKPKQPFGTGFNNLLGAGLMTASYFENRNNQKNQALYQRDRNMSSNLPVGINPNPHGNYDQQGQRPMNQYAQSPTMAGYAQNGGRMQTGGYTKGQEVELSEQEMNDLIRRGYKLQKI